jgi:hypothetical protein
LYSVCHLSMYGSRKLQSVLLASDTSTGGLY